jgi:flagellar motor switch protein FliN/FliY
VTAGSAKAAGAAKQDEKPLVAINSDLLRDVRVSIEARLGRTDLTVAQLTALKTGSVVTLETSLADHVELYLNGVLVARGEIVAVGEVYGVRITDIGADG